MFAGGLRALLLQSLHPLAMAAVAEHSDYRGDPWGRLQRTSYFLAVTTFGPASDAQQAVDRVRAVHQHVTGTAPDGRPYRASDPHLLPWVHIAETDSFLRATSATAPSRSTRRDATATSPISPASRRRSACRPTAHRSRTRRADRRVPARTRRHRPGPRGGPVPAAASRRCR